MVGTLGLSIFIYNMAVYLSSHFYQGQPVIYRSMAGTPMRLFGLGLPTRVDLILQR